MCCFVFSNQMHDDAARKHYFSLEYGTNGDPDEFQVTLTHYLSDIMVLCGFISSLLGHIHDASHSAGSTVR